MCGGSRSPRSSSADDQARGSPVCGGSRSPRSSSADVQAAGCAVGAGCVARAGLRDGLRDCRLLMSRTLGVR